VKEQLKVIVVHCCATNTWDQIVQKWPNT